MGLLLARSVRMRLLVRLLVLPALVVTGSLAFGAPTAELTIPRLMDIVEHSTSYVDFITRLTSTFPPLNTGTFFGQHGDESVTPTTPQVILRYQNAMVAYAPRTYSEAMFSVGNETVQFQFVENAQGKMTINAYTFRNSATPVDAPDHLLTPEMVRTMSTADLVAKTSRYAEKVCVRCHLDIRRRLFEPSNFGRRYQADPGWVFRTEAQGRRVRAELGGLFKELTDGGASLNPLYAWLWKKPAVVARGGQLKPEDTFDERAFAREAMIRSAREMLQRLKTNANWAGHAEAFAAAVEGRTDDFARILIKAGHGATEIKKRRREAALFLARQNLTYTRRLNDENVAWILSRGQQARVAEYSGLDYLLINRKAIEAIGPEIFNLIVGEAEWAAMAPEARIGHVRLSDLDVRDPSDLVNLVMTDAARRADQRRVDTYLVLLEILQNKNKALAHLSGSLGVNALTAGTGANVLDVYAAELPDCRIPLSLTKGL